MVWVLLVRVFPKLLCFTIDNARAEERGCTCKEARSVSNRTSVSLVNGLFTKIGRLDIEKPKVPFVRLRIVGHYANDDRC